MEDDQQFCLRWNNHQSTLVAVFDTLLENGTLVDCTLAAEGKFLNAHKVVLSACSPYFEALLSKHFDKHPILILKDVKFQELKAMMDYMYRGEVNISQDQLGALLKAAESLQIKGLSDNRKGETERKPAPAPPPPKSPQPASTIPKVQGLTIEQRSRDDSREGSMSPGPRKKKRMRRKSEELDNHHDASNSSESHSLPATQNIPLLPTSKMNADVPDTIETKQEILTARLKQSSDEAPQVPMIKEKLETHSELMLEPKAEYVEEMNEDSIEDLTLDDDDLSNMEQMDDSGAGPSHGNAGEGSSQGFGGWHMGNQSQDEVFLAAQEAVGAHRDSQGYHLSIQPLLEVLKLQPVKRRLSISPSKIVTVLSKKQKGFSDTKPAMVSTGTQKMPTFKTARGRKKKLWKVETFYERGDGKKIQVIRCATCRTFVSKDATQCKVCVNKALGIHVIRRKPKEPKTDENKTDTKNQKVPKKVKKEASSVPKSLEVSTVKKEVKKELIEEGQSTTTSKLPEAVTIKKEVKKKEKPVGAVKSKKIKVPAGRVKPVKSRCTLGCKRCLSCRTFLKKPLKGLCDKCKIWSGKKAVKKEGDAVKVKEQVDVAEISTKTIDKPSVNVLTDVIVAKQEKVTKGKQSTPKKGKNKHPGVDQASELLKNN